MKDATGELSMTVVVIIAVIAIVGILTTFLVPSMRNYITHAWDQMTEGSNKIESDNSNMSGRTYGG